VGTLVYFCVHVWEGSLAVDVNLATLADYADLSKDNKLNILGVFQEINTRTFPVTVPHMYAVLSCEAEPTEYGKKLSIRVVLLDEDNDANEVLALEGLAEIAEPKHSFDRVTMNQVVGLSFVQFKHPGNYRFAFFVEGEEIASVPLRVNKVD
jgi:hypothetical protein